MKVLIAPNDNGSCGEGNNDSLGDVLSGTRVFETGFDLSWLLSPGAAAAADDKVRMDLSTSWYMVDLEPRPNEKMALPVSFVTHEQFSTRRL
jgi:hypothetical protein